MLNLSAAAIHVALIAGCLGLSTRQQPFPVDKSAALLPLNAGNAMSLDDYRRKRRFGVTSEPDGDGARVPRNRPIFVVQLDASTGS